MRALEGVLFVVFVSCAAGDKPDVGEREVTTGGAYNLGGSGGTGNDGTSEGGDAGDEGGSSGMSQSGSSGTSQGGAGPGHGGSAGDGVAAAGGQDSGEGTVTGVVRTEWGGPNENVLIAIGSATTMTDEDGRFEIRDVAPEYDLVLVAAEESYALVIRGISERTLSLRAPGSDALRFASIAGVVTGGAGTPLPADCVARAAFMGSSISVTTLFDVDVFVAANDASYALDLLWNGPANVPGFLYALEYRVDSMNRVISYDGYGSKPFGISDSGMYGRPDGSIPATTIALAPVASRTVSGKVTLPPGSLLTSAMLTFSVGLFITDRVLEPEGTYSAVVPTGIAGTQNLVSLSAQRLLEDETESSYAAYLIEDAVTTLDLSTPEEAAVPILPAGGALGVYYDTQFSWESPANSLSALHLSVGGWFVSVVTDASSATLPNLTEYGVSHEPGAEGTWWVAGVVGQPSADEWVRLGADPAAYLTAHGRIAETRSSIRTFNLAK